jgi:hypothetical protein
VLYLLNVLNVLNIKKGRKMNFYEPEQIDVGPDAKAHDVLVAIYRNPQMPLHTRMRAAIAAIPFESPKLIATAIVNEKSFAAILERRYLHMRKVQAEQQIEYVKPKEPKAKPEPAPARPPLPHVFDRRYRRI